MAELQDVKQKDRRKRAVRTGPPSQEVRQINTIFKKPRQKAVLLIKDHGSPYHETERTERRKSVGRDGQSGSSLQKREQSQQSQSCPQAFRTCNLSGRCSLASCLKHGLHFQQLPRLFCGGIWAFPVAQNCFFFATVHFQSQRIRLLCSPPAFSQFLEPFDPPKARTRTQPRFFWAFVQKCNSRTSASFGESNSTSLESFHCSKNFCEALGSQNPINDFVISHPTHPLFFLCAEIHL